MKFKLEEYHRDISDDDLIQDLKKVAEGRGKNTLTRREYNEFGKYTGNTLSNRFGSWFKALEKAGLDQGAFKKDIPTEELFENIKNIWIVLGRQPRYAEIKPPLSKFSTRPYDDRFGSWRKTLQAFIEYINDDEAEKSQLESDESKEVASIDKNVENFRGRTRRTKREISERLRFSILMRDGFRCQSCGKSPITSPGVELHVDHILPWSKGGETVLENLQTKCKECNLGKGNAFDQ